MKPIKMHPTDNHIERCCDCEELIENPGWAIFDGDVVEVKPMCKECYINNHQENERTN